MEIRGKIEEDIVLSENTDLSGMVVGNVVVQKNVALELHGMVVGNLVLEQDSEVYLHGMVTKGDVINNGGCLKVFGMVVGKIRRNSGETIVDKNAIVRNGRNLV